MKYRDENGVFQDLYLPPTGDTLPIGSEVDYDGDMVPYGWEEVESNVKILWTNPNPTSNFSQQNITLNSNDYDMYEIIFAENTSLSSRAFSTGKILKNRQTVMSVPLGYGGSHITVAFRMVQINSDTELNIVGPYNYDQSGGSTTYTRDNSTLIPLYIIGYRTGLFS